MANLFFRTNIAPYRIDTYNALHKRLGCEFYFLYKDDSSQKFNMQALYDRCIFKPKFLKTLSIISKRQKVCLDIWKILSRENPEIVIVPEFKILSVQVLLYKWIFKKKFKVISMCDDSWDMVANNHDFSTAHKKMRQLVTPFLDNLLLVDSKVKDWYNCNYGKGIWLPIIRDEKYEIKEYERVLPLSREYLKKFKLKGKKVLLFVGRLVSEKNVGRLIEAIAKTKEDFVSVIVGNGELENSLKQEASNINKPILFVGRYEGDGIRAWYNVADVFILPSTLEPFGAVTNEALIAGCNCIISENAGSNCLINDKNGKIFNPYDVEKIANTIDQTMQKINCRLDLKTRLNNMSITFSDTIDRVINEICD